MSYERTTSCIDFTRRFDSFVDGELDAHSMRAMALHASHCPECGAEVERTESLQALLSQAVESEVERLDTSRLWGGIEARLEQPRFDPRVRVRALVAALRPSAVPALAITGALAALLLALLWPGSTPSEPVEVANNQAQIQRIESSAPQVGVWSEPERHTTAIWVASYEPEGTP